MVVPAPPIKRTARKFFFSFRYDEDRYRADALSATLGEQAIWRRRGQIGMPYLLWTH